MENSTFLLNVDFAAQWPNGFVGETLIFVISAIKSKFQGRMCQDYQKISYQNVKERENAQSEDSIQPTEVNIVWVVASVGVIKWT